MISSIFVSEKNKNLYVIDIASGSTTVSEDDRLQQISNLFSQDYLCVSPDGRYAAMCCADQKVWILDTQNKTINGGMPMYLMERSFLQFSNDSRYLFLQGNDYAFRIWDVKNEEYMNSFETNSAIKYTVYDPEDRRLALITGYSLYFLNLDDYRQCAYVPDCVAYIKDSNSFIQCSRGSVFRCHYKNYQTLIEETQRQFPGAELTDLELVEYNINCKDKTMNVS